MSRSSARLKKIRKIGKLLQYYGKYCSAGKIKNIGSLTQVRKIVWLNESIEVKKNQKNWQVASVEKIASFFHNKICWNLQ